MWTHFPPKNYYFLLAILLLAAGLTGCSHSKTERGHLFRGDWAFEYNRTPWIGMPADSGSAEDGEKKGGGLFDCFKKEKDGKKGYRRHCGQTPNCTAQNPCCRTLGCGMWVDPSADAQTAMVSLGGTAKACGLTPFCSPQKPCGLTPNCGKPVSVTIPSSGMNSPINPQTIFLGNNMTGGMTGGIVNGGMSATMPFASPLAARSVPGGMNNAMNNAMGTAAAGNVAGIPAPAAATLVGRGIVPGASLILNNGGMVTAIGVATPAGTMTASGVRMANGGVNPNVVLRSCTMTPNCTAARPCGLTPGCGGMVALNLVANNAVGLASALQAQGVAGGVMQANGGGIHGMGTLVNPMTNQPISGLTMGGYPQQGYPPMGYAPTGYAPGYPRYAPGEVQQNTGKTAEEEESAEESVEQPSPAQEARSKMPVPRFQPMPSKPAFQRSEGLKPTPKSQRKPETVAMNEAANAALNEAEMEEQLDRAYLEGVAAAMDEIERKMESRQQAAAKAQLQEKIRRQTAMMERQLAAQATTARAEVEEAVPMLAVNEPRRLPTPKPAVPVQMVSAEVPSAKAAAKGAGTSSKGGLAKLTSLTSSIKNTLAAELSTLRSPLLGGNRESDLQSGGRKPDGEQSADASVAVRTAVPTTLPPKPSVSGMRQNYGLLPDNDTAEIQQAEFSGENR